MFIVLYLLLPLRIYKQHKGKSEVSWALLIIIPLGELSYRIASLSGSAASPKHPETWNTLAWYADGSPWTKLKPVLDTLIDRRYQLVVLVPASSIFMNSNEPSHYLYEPFNILVSKEVMKSLKIVFASLFMRTIKPTGIVRPKSRR